MANSKEYTLENGQKVMLRADGARTDSSDAMQTHGVECVGNVTFFLQHPVLDALAQADPEKYGAVKGGVYLTGFKLESTSVRTESQLDNAKLIPMLNGDTMTLTNANKSGTLTFACTRTAAGITGGDIVAICDFIRTNGDNSGGTLTISWYLNSKQRAIVFDSVCVKRCPPLLLAGNDLPDYDTQLTYATFRDSDFPVLAF